MCGYLCCSLTAVCRMEHTLLWKNIQHASEVGLLAYFKDMKIRDVEKLLQYVHAKSGDSVVHMLARHGQLKALQYVHIHCRCSLDSLNLDGKTPLHEAAVHSQNSIVQYLLSQVVNVDPLKKAGWPPLMMACTKMDNLPIVVLLVEAGADLSLKNKDGWNCFHVACRTGDLSVLAYLHGKSASLCRTVSNNLRTPLHTAALHGRCNVVKFLVDTCELKPSDRDSCGSTALMDAVRSGDVETLDTLSMLDSSAFSQTDAIGRNCLHIAAEAGQVSSVKFLIERGGMDPNCRVEASGVGAGQTPLHFAFKENHTDAVSALAKLGATDEILDDKGRLPRDMVVKRYRRIPST